LQWRDSQLMRLLLALLVALIAGSAAAQQKLDLGRSGGVCPLNGICSDTPPAFSNDRRVLTGAWYFATRTAPNIQLLAGSGTYTTPANTFYLEVEMVGGGGGGGGSGRRGGLRGNGGQRGHRPE